MAVSQTSRADHGWDKGSLLNIYTHVINLLHELKYFLKILNILSLERMIWISVLLFIVL